MEISKKILIGELNLPVAAIEDKIIETTRWSTLHEIVFKYNDKFYQTTYSCGSTEQQDESPWEYEEEVECAEVEQVEKVVKVWQAIK